VYSKLSLKPISHLDRGMVWLIAEYLDPHYISINRKQIEELIRINSLHIKGKIKEIIMM
jgi:hypothetical protein